MSNIFWVFFQIYRIAIAILVQIVRWTLPLWPEKIQNTFALRDEAILPLLAERPIWIHAASGEIEYAKPIIRRIQTDFPKVPILISYSSPSAEKLLPTCTELLKTFPLPWDTRFQMKRCLNMLKPRMILIARTDLWPELLYQSQKAQVPTLLFALTLSKDSSRLDKKFRWFFRTLLSLLSEIHTVAEEDQKALQELRVSCKTRRTGDARYDQVTYRRSHPHFSETKPEFLKGKTLILGSTWPEDEAVLLPSLSDFVARGNSVVIAPHELKLKHLESLQSQFKALNFSVKLFSERKSEGPAQILILNQIGVLADIYAWGDCAFVGGSFKEKIHSVMEPLSHGLPVAVGPYHLNNREACDFQKVAWGGLYAVTPTKNQSELRTWLDKILSQNFEKDRLIQEVKSRTGGTEAVMEFIRNH